MRFAMYLLDFDMNKHIDPTLDGLFPDSTERACWHLENSLCNQEWFKHWLRFAWLYILPAYSMKLQVNAAYRFPVVEQTSARNFMLLKMFTRARKPCLSGLMLYKYFSSLPDLCRVVTLRLEAHCLQDLPCRLTLLCHQDSNLDIVLVERLSLEPV